MDNPTPLISALELAEIINQPNVKVFDIRGKWNGNPEEAKKEYRNSHIESAVFLDWTKHFLEQDKPINFASVCDEVSANNAFCELGISKNDTVILYDDYHHMFAGRIWWSMRYHGFNNIKILNGGYQNWLNQNLPISTNTPQITKGDFKSTTNSHLRVDTSLLIKTKNEINLIDGRGSKNYKGFEDKPRSGHIPGAINIPYSSLLDSETGLFKNKAELEQLFNNVLPNLKTTKTVSSCGSGYAGSVVLIALNILDISAPLYDGSFSEWEADQKNPVSQLL